jgi:hypothetical protein
MVLEGIIVKFIIRQFAEFFNSVAETLISLRQQNSMNKVNYMP